MDTITKKRMIDFLDKFIFFFFITLVVFLPVSNTGIEISFGCILFGMIVKAVLQPPSFSTIKRFFSDRINLAVLVFYVLIGLSLVASGPMFAKSLKAWITKWGEGVLLFYFARAFLRKEQIKILLYVLLGTAFLICIDGLYQKIVGVDFIRGFKLNDAGNFLAVRATFSHYNDFATFLVTVFFVNLGIFVSLKKSWGKIVSAFLALLIITNMTFTYSRGSWVAFFAVCLFLAMFVSDKKAKAAFLLILAIFLAGLFIVPALRERVIFIVQKGGDAGRFGIWAAAISIFKDSPIVGCGLGLFMDNCSKYGVGGQYAHNCYLQILAETGILGLASFLWIIGELARRSYKKLRRQLNVVTLGIFSGFLAFLVHAFFDTQLYSLKLSLFFWVIIAFLAKLLEEDKTERGI